MSRLLDPCGSKNPSDWNSRLECLLPRLPVCDATKQHVANALFFVALLQSVPTGILAYTVWRTGETDGLNLAAYAVQLVISSFWVAYGMVIRSFVVSLASALLIVTTLVLMALVVAVRRRRG
jgi:tryptophan-rich sensory protein